MLKVNTLQNLGSLRPQCSLRAGLTISNVPIQKHHADGIGYRLYFLARLHQALLNQEFLLVFRMTQLSQQNLDLESLAFMNAQGFLILLNCKFLISMLNSLLLIFIFQSQY